MDKPVRPASEVARMDQFEDLLRDLREAENVNNAGFYSASDTARRAAWSACTDFFSAQLAEVRAAALEEAARTVDTATMSEWHFYHADSVEEIPRMVQKIGLDYRAAIGKQVRALATRSTEEPAK